MNYDPTDEEVMLHLAAAMPLPSLEHMVQQAMASSGTPHQRLAMEALAVTLAYEQAKRLDKIAEKAMDHPFEAMQEMSDWASLLHCPLYHLRISVHTFASDEFVKAGRRKRREEKKAAKESNRGAIHHG